MRAFLCVLLAFVWLSDATAFAATPEETYRAAQDRLTAEYDGSDAEAEAPSPTLRAFWDAVDGLLSARGPKGLAQFMTVNTLPLRQGTMLVAADWEDFGHLAVIENGKVAWSSSTDQNAPGCWRGAHDRPCMMADIGVHPPDIGLLATGSDGAPRFFVQADYFQPAGGTRGHQLSLWRWTPGKAETFFTTDFVTGGDAAQGVAVAGNEVKITGKGYWLSFSVCGSCDGRQQTHRLRVTPTGVEDLGWTSLTPELDAVDLLLGRLADKHATDDIATPAAAALLKKSWHDTIFITDPPTIGDHSACLAPEDLPPLTFRFGPDPKAMRIVAVEPGPCR